MPKFSKLRSNSAFPDIDSVNVYKYDNDFDYSRYNYKQMSIQMCTVPWDVGEAHVGQRTISGIGNVVWFETKEKRNAWFDAIPDDKCYRFETKFKELHRDQTIDLPIPFDVCARYNYLVVKYDLFANDDSPVMYENDKGLREWFWFIREVEFIAPNTTRLHLLDDAFQTWMYDVNISSMVLERGHAPMFAMRTDDYLRSPIDNNDYLLCEDVNYGTASQVKHIDALALNSGDMWACVATSANPRGTWGDKDDDSWKTPASAYYNQNGVPSVYVFAMETGDLNAFLSNITSDYPQFKQTIQGIFFAPKNLVSTNVNFEFADINCYTLNSSRQTFDLCELNKALFGYDSKYADIAKLYTSPYAHIEITDENGNIDVIKIEDTTGNIDVSASLSLAYPFISIDAHLLGTGGKASANITFRNVTSRTFNIAGTWYETLRNWKIPTFAVVLSAAKQYDYSTHFDRAQRVVDYTTEYNNASASTTTTQTNSNASALANRNNTSTMASAAKANADASAATDVSNTAIQVNANKAITDRSNSSALSDASLSNALSQASQAWEAGYSRDTVNNEVNAEYASAAIGAAGGMINSAISGAASGGLIGAGIGLLTGAVGGATSAAQTAVAANLKTTQAEATISLSQNKVDSVSQNNNDRTTNQNNANSDNATTSNTASTGITANNSALTKNNATRTQSATNTAATNTYNTETANNGRAYNTSIANAGRNRDRSKSAITNDIAQAALNQPFIYGAFSDGESATNKPMALFANIVTQSKSAISSAGDEFLRYGYIFDKQWQFNGNWNVGKYFTYWKLKDFWVYDLNVPDMYMDKLRFFLFGGVTIWRKPEDIGKVSIYDNFN